MFLLDPVDVAVLLGSSQPYADRKFREQKALAKKVLRKFDISRQGVLPAFVSYGPIPTAVSRIGDITDILMAERTIDLITNAEDSSNISSALNLVRNYVFSIKQGARPNVGKSILMFVDKKKQDDSEVMNELAKKFKDEGTRLVVIGLGDEIEKDALKAMTHNNGAIFFPAALEDLEKMIEPVYAALKPGKDLF